MTHVNIPAIARNAHPVVQIENGQAVTTSVEVARVFGKQHNHVLRDIENLRKDLSVEHQSNFGLMSITVDIGNGATRQSPAYHLTRDGFTLLAFGFTGKKAMAFKLAYIDAFNRMEAALSESKHAQKALPPPPAPEPHKALSPDVAQEIAAQASRSILETLQKKNLLINWAQVIDALTDRNSTITLYELTNLIHASLTRLQKNVNAEAQQCITLRAANQGVSTMQVSLNA